MESFGRAKSSVNNKMCCVYGCQNRNTNTTMHTIPKDLKLRRLTIHKCKLGKKLNKHDRVCTLDFTATDYKTGTIT